MSFRVDGETIRKAEGSVESSFDESVGFLHDQVQGFAMAQRAGLKDFELEALDGYI